VKELRREPADTGADGVWLSDGYIYFAILKYGGDDTPTWAKARPRSRHPPHRLLRGRPRGRVDFAGSCQLYGMPGSSKVNRKFKGPTGDDRRARSGLGRTDQGPDAALSADAGIVTAVDLYHEKTRAYHRAILERRS